MPDGQPAPPNNPSIISANALQVLEAGQPTNLIIEKDRAFQIAMEFTLGGSIASGLVGVPLTFTIKYYFDELAGPAEGMFPNSPVIKTTKAGELTYNATTPVGSETVLDVAPNTLTPATYRLNAVVNFAIVTPTVTVPQGFYAFTDGPIIEIVEP
jgi:hypothetical protein